MDGVNLKLEKRTYHTPFATNTYTLSYAVFEDQTKMLYHSLHGIVSDAAKRLGNGNGRVKLINLNRRQV